MPNTFYPENLINNIRDNLDIIEIVSQYVSLKKSGENYKGLCPFHSEKTPSFTVSSKKQIFHCFGCHIGGNIYSFIMKMEGYSFPQAVKFLAKKAGVSLPTYLPNEISKKDILLEINNLAADFYWKNIKSSESIKAYEYLKNRNISDHTIDKFKLGYASAFWDNLYKYLTLKKILPETIKEAGLTLSKKSGGYYDRFRGRVVFPIFDLQNRIVGFGARVLDNSLPKYINSPETLIYNKSQILYGLNFAKEAIREKGLAILVEGYFDVIIPYQLGISNIVATLGTSLTESHAQIIKRYTNKVVLIFDPDNAGINATLRSLDIFLEKDIEVQIVTLPEKLDPAEFLLQKGVSLFSKLLDAPKNFLDYKIDMILRKIDPKNTRGKINLINELRHTYLKLPSRLHQEEFIKKIADKANLDEKIVLLEISSKTPFYNSSKPKKSLIQEVEKKSLEAEKNILKVFFQNSELSHQVISKINVDDFENSECRAIYSLILKKIKNHEEIKFRSIIDDLTPSTGYFFSKIAIETDSKITLKIIEDYIKYFYTRRLNKKIKEIKEKEKKGPIDQILIQECYNIRKEIEK
ncbi:MAG: DNA primase [bacterium]|nr:DNA primase [bacterium]